MADPTRTARYLVAQSGYETPRVPSYDELLELARAHLATIAPGETLGRAGQIVVSLAAAEQYADAEGIDGIEQARRELTELLIDARPTSEPGKWRARSRSTGLDITARVAAEGRLLIVTSVHVREHDAGGLRG